MSKTLVGDGPRIMHTAFDACNDRWLYALDNGIVAKAARGDARIPCGCPYNEFTQWGANQLAKAGIRIT